MVATHAVLPIQALDMRIRLAQAEGYRFFRTDQDQSWVLLCDVRSPRTRVIDPGGRRVRIDFSAPIRRVLRAMTRAEMPGLPPHIRVVSRRPQPETLGYDDADSLPSDEEIAATLPV